MGQAPRELAPQVSTRHFFGAELRLWRQRRACSQDRLGALVHASGDLIAKVEKAERWPPLGLAARCDAVLDTGGVLERLSTLVEQERTIARSQAIADRAGAGLPASAAVIGSELELAAATGDGWDMVEHWHQLLRVLAERSNARGPSALLRITTQQVALIDHERRQARSALAMALLAVQARWTEFASWTFDNAGLPQDASRWADVAFDQATEAGDVQMIGYALMRQSQQAADRADPSTTVVLAQAAQRQRGLTLRTRALGAVREAQGHALANEAVAARRKIVDAYRLADRADPQPDAVDGHCTHPYLAAHEGQCRMLLGEPAQAVTLLEDVLKSWHSGQRQDEGLFRAWLATAYAAERRLPEAGVEGLRALELAHTTGSARSTRAVGALARQLDAVDGPSEVGQFLAAYRIVAARSWNDE